MNSHPKYLILILLAFTLSACRGQNASDQGSANRSGLDVTRQILSVGQDQFEMIRTRNSRGEAVALVRPLTFVFDDHRDETQTARMNAVVPQVEAGLCPGSSSTQQIAFSSTNSRTDFTRGGQFPDAVFTNNNLVHMQLIVHGYCD